MKRWAASGIVVVVVIACGGRSGTPTASDAGTDATTSTPPDPLQFHPQCQVDGDCSPDESCDEIAGGRSNVCCLRPGRACGSSGGPCCAGANACVGGTCPACNRDGRCRDASECCSGNCNSSGYCTPWNLGHACTVDADCWSNLCRDGVCKCGVYEFLTTDEKQCCDSWSADGHCADPSSTVDAGAPCPGALCTCLHAGWRVTYGAGDCCSGQIDSSNGSTCL